MTVTDIARVGAAVGAPAAGRPRKPTRWPTQMTVVAHPSLAARLMTGLPGAAPAYAGGVPAARGHMRLGAGPGAHASVATQVLDRTYLRRVVAVANGKGGVGKTSTSTHTAGLVAASGQRVLLIDLDPQGNAAQDLGYGDGDRGASLVALYNMPDQAAPLILRDVRPNLDVIPGGSALEQLADMLHSRRLRERSETRGAALRAFGAALAPHVGGYDLVIIDCPPANSGVLQDAALAMAQYMLVPTKSDLSSRKGLVEMAERWAEARAETNPELTLLGVVLFGLNSTAHAVRRTAREWIEAALQGQAPVFDAYVRHVEATAVEVRERGLLAHELETEQRGRRLAVVDQRRRRAEAEQQPDADAGGVGTATGLARDYQNVATEVLARIVALETAA